MQKTKQNNIEQTIEAFLAVFRQLKSRLNYKNPLLHLPVVQMQVLHFICEQKQATMKAIADFLAITPPSATALVNNLVDQDFLHRSADSRDRRTVHIRMTKKGAEILKKSMSEHCLRLGKLLDKLSQKEKLQFVVLLNKMVK